MADATTATTTPTKTPYIHRGVKAPATGARFLPGRVAAADAANKDKILFHGVPFYDKVMQNEGNAVAGVPFGPGMELDSSPATSQLDKFKLEDGARIILAGATADSRVIKPQIIQAGDKWRKQIYQFSLEKIAGNVLVMPEKKEEFVWEIWTGFYSRRQLDDARILMQNGQFLHGAGPFQGAKYVVIGATASTTGLVKTVKGIGDGTAQEVQYRLGMVDGIPLWQAYYFVAKYTPKTSEGVVVRQLHQSHVLTCAGGVPKVLTLPAEALVDCYNDAGVPKQARMAA